MTAYQRFLAPPEPDPLDDEARLGLSLFSAIGCESCHLNLETGEASSEALSFQSVDLWSDLLLHDMGPGLADGVVAGAADGSEWRTTPLWGLGDRAFFLHDGRTTDLEEAILAHGGESQASRDAYAALSDAEKDAILAFLRSL